MDFREVTTHYSTIELSLWNLGEYYFKCRCEWDGNLLPPMLVGLGVHVGEGNIQLY